MYKVGEKVRIVAERPHSPTFSYQYHCSWSECMDKWLGKVMTVRAMDRHGCYLMREDDSENISGWHWQPDWIESLVKGEEDKQMKPTGFKEAAKINISGRPYYYALYGSAGVKEGDKVLVTGTATGRIHTVEEVVPAETALLEVEKPLCEEVVCKVDTSAYDARVKQREQKAKLRKLMEATVAQMDEVDKFKVYAEHSPEMAKLLAQYNEINV